MWMSSEIICFGKRILKELNKEAAARRRLLLMCEDTFRGADNEFINGKGNQ